MNSELANFKKVVRGYDPEAVEQAWNELQQQLIQANAANKEIRLQLNSLHEQNTGLGNKLKAYEKMESDLRDALLSAQRIANQIKEESNREAEFILLEARRKAEVLLAEATLIADEKSAEAERLVSETQDSLAVYEQKLQALEHQEQEIRNVITQADFHLEALQQLFANT